ncbi:MAG: hypothetical protein U9N86_11100, partial [Bacteroidota bacterium]|nr:hypothetical protein [Bacteroidota bacterium]
MKRGFQILFITLILLSTFSLLKGQGLSNHRIITIPVKSDSVQLDSLSVIPDSFEAFYPNKQPVPDSLFVLKYAEGRFLATPQLRSQTDSILVKFRVFPINLSEPYRHKEPGFNTIDPLSKPRFYTLKETINPFDMGGSLLNTSGNLSRGIQIGNNQDASLNSNLNLQLSGKINQQFRIEAQLSDSNIPVQPEGNTRQIQDFDRFYIRVFSPETQLLAGDFVLDSPNGYFMRMNRNIQG